MTVHRSDMSVAPRPVGLRFALLVVLAMGPGLAPAARADEELSIEEDQPAAAPAAAPAAGAAPAAAAAKPAARARPSGATITSVDYAPVGNRIEIRVTGKGALAAKVTKIGAENKYVLDFAGTKYQARSVILNAPGLGAIKNVYGAQNKANLARVVVVMNNFVTYTTTKAAGSFIISLNTRAEAGPEEATAAAAAPRPADGGTARPAAPASTAAATAAASSSPAAESAAPAGEPTGGRARVMHAMVDDLPDRSRLVVTADGVLRYRVASQDDGKELVLTLFDVDLAWAPARLAVKDGPIADVRAETVKAGGGEVRVNIKLRTARPYHVRRDQNQVVVEVEKVTEAEAVAESSHRGGDLTHKITLNVQNEDLASLVKALAFEAGFENVVLNKSVAGQVTITLREVPFAKGLNLILSPNGLVWKIDRGVLRVALPAEFDAELNTSALSGGGAASSAGSDDEPVSTRVFRLKYVPLAVTPGVPGGAAQIPSVMVQTLTSILVLTPPKGHIDIDQRTNSLIITDATTNFPKLQAIIRQLDVKIPQVMIRARLVEVNRNRAEKMGINWTAESAFPSNPAVTAGNVGADTTQYQLHTGWLGPGFNLDATLNLLETSGDAKLLLNPSIATLQDQAAHVETSDTASFGQITQTVGANGQVLNTQTFITETIPMTLDVVPHINPDGTVNLRVKITQTTAAIQVVGPPNLRTEMAVTSLVVRNGETGVIGGILRDEAQKSVTKVPILGDLPWFLGGAFFRTENITNVKFELVLFLTPAIAEEI